MAARPVRLDTMSRQKTRPIWATLLFNLDRFVTSLLAGVEYSMFIHGKIDGLRCAQKTE
jgi:hypothetical protein